MPKNSNKTKKINLALQGGGAHGAFTWGVLDRLLEDDRLVIEAISGTSAGAINAAVLVDGYEKGGRKGAKTALERFWRTVSGHASSSPYSGGGLSPFAPWFDFLTHTFSPYEFNPANIDPLKDILTETIDFECLRTCGSIRLYISATNVRTGRLRIFNSNELSVDALLASACLPHIRQTVEIDGEHYWDGGFMGNPILEPLIGQSDGCCDIVIVQVNSTHCDEVPRTASEIINRVNEISFNSSLMREIRAIAGVIMLVNSGALEIKDPQYRCTLFHRIAAEDVMKGLKAGSKLDISWPFLTRLKSLGRERAGQWLDENFEHIGRTSTLDLQAWEPAYQ